MSSIAANRWLLPDRITNGYLEGLAKRCGVANFLGVFPCDLLPPEIEMNQCLIINTDPHTRRGFHYICMRRSGSGYLYFDPLKLDTKFSFPTLFENLKPFRPLLPVVKQPIQHLDSLFCGFFCLEYLLSTTQQFSAVKTKSYEKKNLHLNDQICYEKIIAYILSMTVKVVD